MPTGDGSNRTVSSVPRAISNWAQASSTAMRRSSIASMVRSFRAATLPTTVRTTCRNSARAGTVITTVSCGCACTGAYTDIAPIATSWRGISSSRYVGTTKGPKGRTPTRYADRMRLDGARGGRRAGPPQGRRWGRRLMSDELFELQLPSLAEHLATARSFAAAVARHYDVAGEAVGDLQIALSEAWGEGLLPGFGVRLGAEDGGRART